MKDNLTAEQWKQIDGALFIHTPAVAAKYYRVITGKGINVCLDAINDRNNYLLRVSPERFKTDTEYRADAWSRLQAIKAKIVVIEAYWDDDGMGFKLGLSAIAEGRSWCHPRYTEHNLYDCRDIYHEVELCTEFGTELARSVGAEFCLTDNNTLEENWESRWWDDH